MSRMRTKPVKRSQSTFGLNITSMTDMFTILLVFLLQTYASGEVLVTPEKGITMPVSNTDTNPIKALQLSVSNEELKVDQKSVLNLISGQFNTADIDKNDSQFIKPLFDELKAMEKKGPMLIQADQNLSYQTLRQVMYTASMAGFVQIKLATVVGE